jgi:hypothetical protein
MSEDMSRLDSNLDLRLGNSPQAEERAQGRSYKCILASIRVVYTYLSSIVNSDQSSSILGYEQPFDQKE